METQSIGDLDSKLFEKAEKSFQAADHVTYIVYPLLKDTKLLKKSLEEVFISATNLVNSILVFEQRRNRIRLSHDKNQNLSAFKTICSRIDISEPECISLLEMIDLDEKHKKSPSEFMRNDKILILLENTKIETISQEKLKSFINTLKSSIQKFRAYRERKF
jgi:hypothetical protein